MTRNLTANRPGTCSDCTEEIRIGDPIHWTPRRGGSSIVRHRDCDRARAARKAEDARAAADRARAELFALFSQIHPLDGEKIAPDTDRVCLEAGFPSWATIAYLDADRVLLWRAGRSDWGQTIPPTVRAIPRTEEIVNLVRAAEFRGPW